MLPTQNTAGVVTGGFFPAFPYTEESQAWGPTPKTAKADELVVDLTNLDRVRVHAKRARLSCNPELDVTTDGPAQIRLAGCGKTITVG